MQGEMPEIFEVKKPKEGHLGLTREGASLFANSATDLEKTLDVMADSAKDISPDMVRWFGELHEDDFKSTIEGTVVELNALLEDEFQRIIDANPNITGPKYLAYHTESLGPAIDLINQQALSILNNNLEFALQNQDAFGLLEKLEKGEGILGLEPGEPDYDYIVKVALPYSEPPLSKIKVIDEIAPKGSMGVRRVTDESMERFRGLYGDNIEKNRDKVA